MHKSVNRWCRPLRCESRIGFTKDVNNSGSCEAEHMGKNSTSWREYPMKQHGRFERIFVAQIPLADFKDQRRFVLLARDERGPLFDLNFVPDPLQGITRQMAPCHLAPADHIGHYLNLAHYPGLSLRPLHGFFDEANKNRSSTVRSNRFAAYEISEAVAAAETGHEFLLRDHKELWQHLLAHGRLAIAMLYDVKGPEFRLWSSADEVSEVVASELRDSQSRALDLGDSGLWRHQGPNWRVA